LLSVDTSTRKKVRGTHTTFSTAVFHSYMKVRLFGLHPFACDSIRTRFFLRFLSQWMFLPIPCSTYPKLPKLPCNREREQKLSQLVVHRKCTRERSTRIFILSVTNSRCVGGGKGINYTQVVQESGFAAPQGLKFD
jgi:hypothetical protein